AQPASRHDPTAHDVKVSRTGDIGEPLAPRRQLINGADLVVGLRETGGPVRTSWAGWPGRPLPPHGACEPCLSFGACGSRRPDRRAPLRASHVPVQVHSRHSVANALPARNRNRPSASRPSVRLSPTHQSMFASVALSVAKFALDLDRVAKRYCNLVRYANRLG